MYVCMYAYMHACMCVRKYGRMYEGMSVGVSVCLFVSCMCACVYVCLRACVYVCIYVYAHEHARVGARKIQCPEEGKPCVHFRAFVSHVGEVARLMLIIDKLLMTVAGLLDRLCSQQHCTTMWGPPTWEIPEFLPNMGTPPWMGVNSRERRLNNRWWAWSLKGDQQRSTQ